MNSLFLDPLCSSASHGVRVRLRLAAVPQVQDGLGDVQEDHGGPRTQAAAVTRHLQQVALDGDLPADAVQAPLT